MKVSPIQGTGVPAGAETSLGRTADSAKMARAKAIAMGQEVPRGTPEPTTGDQQADRARASIRKIKMRTQQSTNRHENEPIVEQILTEEPVIETNEAEVPISDTNEQADVVEETKPLSPQFAALVKQKRALQVKERELAQREEALKTQAPAGQEDLIAKLKANPLSVLQEAGVTYDQLTEAILNSQSQPIDPLKLRNEIKEELKKELFGELSSRDQQAEQQVLADIEREIVQLTSQGEEYEAIREAKAQRMVRDLIHRTWKSSGEVMDVTEAAELVENQLIEEALPFARIKKVQSRLTPAQEAQAAQIAPVQSKPNTKVMRTLTNRDTASPIMDKRARAIAAMEGRLKR